ncbi:MAG: hypothetical protein EBX97_02440 [Actinobacteria bacterium]|nr:hypothetical protein [Actinomycetota bacterium]
MRPLRIERTEMAQISASVGDTEISFDEWVRIGIENGWCGPPVCYTHDGLPTSPAEDEEFEEGDPCLHIIRLYEDGEQRKAIEDSHSPSQWRNTYTK